jgi:hypothetical protein
MLYGFMGVPYFRWTKPYTFEGSKQATYLGLDGRRTFLFRPDQAAPLVVLAPTQKSVLWQAWDILVQIKDFALN